MQRDLHRGPTGTQLTGYDIGAGISAFVLIRFTEEYPLTVLAGFAFRVNHSQDSCPRTEGEQETESLRPSVPSGGDWSRDSSSGRGSGGSRPRHYRPSFLVVTRLE